MGKACAEMEACKSHSASSKGQKAILWTLLRNKEPSKKKEKKTDMEVINTLLTVIKTSSGRRTKASLSIWLTTHSFQGNPYQEMLLLEQGRQVME